MPDLRNHDFFRSLRWASNALVLTRLEADESFTPVLTIQSQYSAVETEEEKVLVIEFTIVDPVLYASLDLESFDGGQFNGKQYEFSDKSRIAQEPARISLKGVEVAKAITPVEEEDAG